MLTPDFAIAGTLNTHYYAPGDSLVIKNLCVENKGSTRSNDSLQIALYYDSREPANLIKVYKLRAGIDVGTTRCYSIRVAGLSSLLASKLIIELNDDGTRHSQPECDTLSNNSDTIDLRTMPQAANDRETIFTCYRMSLDVLANDIGFGKSTPIILKDGTLGSATLRGQVIAYTNDKSVGGNCFTHGGRRDTVIYRVCAGGNCSDASMFVNIMYLPSMKMFDSCSHRPFLTIDYQYPGATYQWYKSQDRINWTEMPDGKQIKLYVTEDAWYYCHVQRGKLGFAIAAIHVVVKRKTLLPNNTWWYEVGLGN
jgi:hypothetical protein